MRTRRPRVCSMAAEQKGPVELDRAQVKKAAQCLLAYVKSSSEKPSLLGEHDHISLLFTLWKIPKQEQTIRIALPHGIRTDGGDVCLFTKDQPNMTSEQVQRFYKSFLTEKGVKNAMQIIPLSVLKKEYKSFESKRRLLGNFDLFLADARIRRLLPSKIGKHFYVSKKAPLSVDLEAPRLGHKLEQLIQGTTLCVSCKGSCSMARVAHSGMTAEQVVDNIVATFSTVADKLPMQGESIKVVHLKSQSSVALPIYTSDLSHLALLEDIESKPAETVKRKQPGGKGQVAVKKVKGEEMPAAPQEAEEEEEEIPQLVPIATPSKKKKLVSAGSALEEAPQALDVKPEQEKATPLRKRRNSPHVEEQKPKTPAKVKLVPGTRKHLRSAGRGLKSPVQKGRRSTPQSC